MTPLMRKYLLAVARFLTVASLLVILVLFFGFCSRYV